MSGSPYDEERLGELLGSLPPAPGPWVEAAQERPRLERGLEQVLALAEADAEFRAALLADLEAGIREAGIEPDPILVRMLGARLEADRPSGGDA